MIRTRLTSTVFAAIAVALAMWATPARAQDILYARTFDFVSTPVIGGLADLELDFTFVVTFEDLLGELRGQEWDLVIVRGFIPFAAALEGDILAELEAHVARGGALHFQMAELDRVSKRYYDLLGLDGAVELELPLPNIRAPRPVHPSVSGLGFLNVGDELFPPDYGDILLPGPGAFVTQTFEVGGPAATVIARDGQVIVNGPQWDNWQSTGIPRKQIRWLLSCKADLDGDGDLTIFDFLEFQTLFDARDVRADVFYDGRFDIFDFLAFFNQFDAGC
ncbi:MAG: GC-type dockerin domain-anchored protein [Phycisphaerales bacterium JB060]